MDVSQLVASGVVGGIVAALATIIGAKIKSSTAISLKNTDDRSEHNKDLMAQVDSLWAKLKEYEAHVGYFRIRDAIFYRVFAEIGGELRLLNGQVDIHIAELESPHMDLNECLLQARYMKSTTESINKLLVKAEQQITELK